MVLVSVSCITFNQAPYIRECIEGFLMQKTDFEFEILIHDDCSTDGTTEIIREYAGKYPDLIKPMYEEENQYSQGKPIGTPVWNLPRAKGKYIATCEGDDYWTDPYKLQKQADFLENNPEYGMCYTDFDVKNETTGKYTHDIFKNHIRGFKSEYTSAEEFILDQAYMCPPSWMFRKELIKHEMFGSLDNTFVHFTNFLCTTKVKYLDFTSAVYRIISESASHSANFEKLYVRMQNILQTKLKMLEYYNLDSSYKELCIENHYRLNLVDFMANDKKDDVAMAKKMIKHKSSREKILFAIDSLSLSFLLQLVRKILPSRI